MGKSTIAINTGRLHQVCPKCLTEMDRFTGAAMGSDPAAVLPRLGDLAVCANCVSVNRYSADLQLVAVEGDGWRAEVPPQLLRVIDEMRRFITAKRQRN